jgi:hypothetical protein
MQKFSDEEILEMSLGKASLHFVKAILEDIDVFVTDLERNNKIKNATKLRYHLRDAADYLIGLHWHRDIETK